MSRWIPWVSPLAWALLLVSEIILFGLFGGSTSLADWMVVFWAGAGLTAGFAIATLPLEWCLSHSGGPRRTLTSHWAFIVAAALVIFTILALNYHAFARGFIWVPLGIAAATLAAALCATCKTRLISHIFLWLSPAAVFLTSYVNRTVYPDRYLEQHLALSLFGFWLLALWVARFGSTMRRAGQIAGAGLLVALATFALVGRGRVPLDAANALSKELPTPAAATAIISPLSDHDGDGFGSLLVGTDCDDNDPTVNPAAFEIPDNGRDDNCVGGDATGSAVLPETTRNVKGRQARRLLLVTVDALRADRVYGELGKRTAPTMHSLANRCVSFHSAYAVYASTLQSVFSLLHSRYPSQAEGRSECGHFEVPVTSAPSLQEQMKKAGWTAKAAVGTWLLSEKCSLTAGFDQVLVDPVELFDPTPRASELTDLALATLPEDGSFLWVHYIDPHQPYWKETSPEGPGSSASDREAYDWEVSHVDEEIHRLLKALPEDTWIVLSADHGEQFRGDKGTGHLGTDRDALHVPLVFCGPGIQAKTVETPVSLLDLAPTLLDLAGVDRPSSFLGESLVPVLVEQNIEPSRGFAAAEFLGSDGNTRLDRAVFGPDFSIHGYLSLGFYLVDTEEDKWRTGYMTPRVPGYDAWLHFTDGQLRLAPDLPKP